MDDNLERAKRILNYLPTLASYLGVEKDADKVAEGMKAYKKYSNEFDRIPTEAKAKAFKETATMGTLTLPVKMKCDHGIVTILPDRWPRQEEGFCLKISEAVDLAKKKTKDFDPLKSVMDVCEVFEGEVV